MAQNVRRYIARVAVATGTNAASQSTLTGPFPTITAPAELKRRQKSRGFATCGWETGDPNRFNVSYQRRLACLSMVTACIGSATQCGPDCMADSYVLKCNSEYPACTTNKFDNGGSQFGCGRIPLTVSVFSTCSGQILGDKGVPTITASTQSPTLSQEASSTKPNVGVIIGGALGGVAIVALIVLGTLWIRRLGKSQRAIEAAIQNPPDPTKTSNPASPTSPNSDYPSPGPPWTAHTYPEVQTPFELDTTGVHQQYSELGATKLE
ncbi:hypothetical protein EDC01DRAFT_632037 [Geopyxis carbonaria]|nr:hypothetical protein EDC01DRAFT_632037 [Geopyxis carbonaria]